MMMVVVMKLELKVAELVFGLMGWAELRLECNPVMFDNIYHPTLVMMILNDNNHNDNDDFISGPPIQPTMTHSRLAAIAAQECLSQKLYHDDDGDDGLEGQDDGNVCDRVDYYEVLLHSNHAQSSM